MHCRALSQRYGEDFLEEGQITRPFKTQYESPPNATLANDDRYQILAAHRNCSSTKRAASDTIATGNVVLKQRMQKKLNAYSPSL